MNNRNHFSSVYSVKSRFLATRQCQCAWLLLAVSFVLLFSRCAQAGFVNWTYCGTGNWRTDTCWGGFGLPESTDTVQIRLDDLSTATTARVYIKPGDDIRVLNLLVYTNTLNENTYVDQLGGDMWVLDDLELGGDSGDTRYLLKGGTFRADRTFVFADGPEEAIFRQSGGECTIDYLSIGTEEYSLVGNPDSSYELESGTFKTDQVFVTGRKGLATTGPEAWIDQTGGEHINTNFIVLGSGADELGAYLLDSGTLDTPYLKIAQNDGEGRFENRTGTLKAETLGVGHSGMGNFVQNNVNAKTLVSGYVDIATTSEASGSDLLVTEGYFQTADMRVGGQGRGSYNQNGGNVHVTGWLSISEDEGSSGSFAYLNGGSLTTNRVEIGDGDAGSFGHRRGVHTSNRISLYDGSYTLRGGTLNVDRVVNPRSTGTLNVNGGTLNLGSGTHEVQVFNVGSKLYSTGNFTLTSGRTLETKNLTVGVEGGGTFTQAGGDVIASESLIVGYFNDRDQGYNLQDGHLFAPDQMIGRVANDVTFTQNGGTNTATRMWMNRYGGNVSHYIQNAGTTTIEEGLSMGRHGASLYELFGGTLNVGQITNGSGISILSVEGGTLNLTGESLNVDLIRFAMTDGASAEFALEQGKTITGSVQVGAGGDLKVDGSLTGNVTISGGRLGGSGDITGNAKFIENPIFEWEASANDTSDLLQINSGTATLAGAVRPKLNKGYLPEVETTFTILTAPTIVGSFDQIDDSLLPAGVTATLGYTATSVTITLVGTIELMTYDDWKAKNFTAEELIDGLISGPDADPDKDGLTNLQEYTSGTLPKLRNRDPLQVSVASGEYLELSFPWADGISDFDFHVEFGEDLETFSSANHTVVSSESNDGITQYVIRVDISNGGKRGFVRLRTVLRD